MEQEEDSFQAYKNQLEEGLGYNQIKKPIKPMNPYMRFYLEKSSQRKLLEPLINNQFLSKIISQQWRNLDESKKQYYTKLYQISRDNYRSLIDQYQKITGKKKSSSLYSSYISKRYEQYSKQYPNKPSRDLIRLANQDWRKIDLNKKNQMKTEWENQHQQLPQEDRNEQIREYQQKLQQYTQKIEEDKMKIIKKYRLSPQYLKQLEKLKKKNKKIGEKDALKKILKMQQKSEKDEVFEKQLNKAAGRSKGAREKNYQLKKRQIQEIRRQLRSLDQQQYCKKQLIVAVPTNFNNQKNEKLKEQLIQDKQQQIFTKKEATEPIQQVAPNSRRLSKRKKTAQKQSEKDKEYFI